MEIEQEEKSPVTGEVDADDWNPYREDQRLGKRMEAQRVRFELGVVEGAEREALWNRFTELVKEYKMVPFYREACQELGREPDTALVAKLEAENEKELKELDAAVAEAREQYGELEVLDAMKARADFFSRIGDKANTLEALDETMKEGMSSGAKIDLALHKLRVALFHRDLPLARARVEEVKEMVENKGDWDRRNRFKVYHGLYSLLNRDFKTACQLLLESVPTFTAYEMVDFNSFIQYTVLAALLHVPRKDLRKDVVESPDVLTVIDQLPHLGELLNGFYDCEYRRSFKAMVELHPLMLRDPYMAAHAQFYLREYRIRAYAQFLEAYRSVTLGAMAETFGVSVPFIDAELARFISAGRLHAKIDKVGGVLETNRADAKNAQYLEMVEKGDSLLNRVQNLARTINARQG